VESYRSAPIIKTNKELCGVRGKREVHCVKREGGVNGNIGNFSL